MGTNRWLRMIVYDRVNKYATVLTYGLSALWHGFYPVYYLTFASGALFTFAARTVSYCVFLILRAWNDILNFLDEEECAR